MWVADMDFRTPPFVMDALKNVWSTKILGYTFACEEWYTSIINWLQQRYHWEVTREMLLLCPVLFADWRLPYKAVFTEKGDKVMVMPPVVSSSFGDGEQEIEGGLQPVGASGRSTTD